MPIALLRWLSAVPLVVVVVYVAGVTPEVPLLDDWAFVDFAHRVATGAAGWRDWLAPHNGSHVFVVPWAVHTALAFATGGSGQAVLLTSVAVLAATAWLIVRMGQRSPAGGRPALAWAQLATMLLLCSPAAYRAFIWPATFGHFAMNAFVVTAAWSLSRPRDGDPMRALLPAILACGAASITRSEGVMSWLVMTPLVFMLATDPAQRRRVLIVWGVAAACFIGIVIGSLVGLTPENGKPLPTSLLAHPLLSLGNALGMIGMAFGVAVDGLLGDSAFAPRRYFWLGLPIVAAFFFFGWRGLRATDEAVRRMTTAWLSIGCFGGLFVNAVSFARIGVLERPLLGDVWPSAYAVTAGLVGVATLQLAALNAGGTRSERRAAPIAMGLVLALLLGAYVARGPDALHHRWRTSWSGLCWELFEHLAPFNACFVQQPTREQVKVFEDLGFREIRSDLEVVREPNAFRGEVEAIDALAGASGDRAATGWVRTPDDGEEPVVFIEITRLPGLIAPARLDAAKGGRAQWRANLPEIDGDLVVRAWVYQRKKGVLMRLGGEARGVPRG